MSSAREWNSQAYHRLSDNQFAWGKKVVSRLVLRGDETVLDAGCGSGRVTSLLVERLPRGRVVGVDLSENMVGSARDTILSNSHPERERTRRGRESNVPYRDQERRASAGVHLLCADLLALPFAPVFDGIFSTAVFHWITCHSGLFRELFRVLKPGGWLEAQCGGGPNLARLRGRAAKVIASAPYERFFRDWTEPWEYADPQTTARRLAAAGFVDVRTGLEPAAFTISDPQQYREYLATVTLHRHVAQIADPDLRHRFLDDVTRLAVADGDMELDYWRLNISAKKTAR